EYPSRLRQPAEALRGGTGLEPVVRVQFPVEAGDPARERAGRDPQPACDGGVRHAGGEQQKQLALIVFGLADGQVHGGPPGGGYLHGDNAREQVWTNSVCRVTAIITRSAALTTWFEARIIPGETASSGARGRPHSTGRTSDTCRTTAASPRASTSDTSPKH